MKNTAKALVTYNKYNNRQSFDFEMGYSDKFTIEYQEGKFSVTADEPVSMNNVEEAIEWIKESGLI